MFDLFCQTQQVMAEEGFLRVVTAEKNYIDCVMFRSETPSLLSERYRQRTQNA